MDICKMHGIQMPRYTLFISDLHLQASQPHIAQSFKTFMREHATGADALYILGDFVEAWLGDNDRCDFNQKVKTILKQYTNKGLTIYFMRGNRDFLIGKRFAKETGVKLLEDPTIIKLYGKRVLLMHGDSLCTLDKKHQAFRKRAHHPIYKTIMMLAPLSLRRFIGEKLRSYSKNRNETLNMNIMDVTPDEVERVMTEYGVNLLIHGHTHKPATHDLKVKQQDAKRIVLGDWHKSASYLLYHSDDQYQLIAPPIRY